jgi:hypothetical protein
MLRSVFAFVVLSLVSGPVAAQYGDTVECSSQDYRREHCEVDWRDARVERQLSNTRCERGENWDIDRRGLWVDGGCSAVFVEAGRRGGRDDRDDRDDRRHGRDDNDWRPGGGWDSSIRVRCESESYDYYMCRVDTGRGSNVYVDNQISNTRCVEGQNWGWNRAGIWVNDGCAAVFMVERRWR